MISYYVNVADERDLPDIQVVRSHTFDNEAPLKAEYDVRRSVAQTICEKVLTKFNLNAVEITVRGEGLDITLAPLRSDPFRDEVSSDTHGIRQTPAESASNDEAEC